MATDVPSPPPSDLTRLLAGVRAGRRDDFDGLFAIVYDELRSLARGRRRAAPSDTLNTTALLHETYLKLAGGRLADVQDRRHFFAVAAKAMRQIVIDHARAVLAGKRGGGAIRVSVDDIDLAADTQAGQLVDLDEALARLAALNARLSTLVELRFFAGLTVEETADVLDTSPRTVKRDWRKARAFLHLALQPARPGDRPNRGTHDGR
jgi:RNA polymerase sigma factor (TIGR02999 family)